MQFINLRKATKEDAKKLCDLKNDKVVRKFSIVTNSIIEWDNHLEWIKENLKYIQIIEYDGHFVGDVRIEDDEVAIKLNPAFRGLGFAKQVLNEVKYNGMKAKIVKGNEASMKLFLGAGFEQKDFKKGIYYLEYESNPVGLPGQQTNTSS